MGTGTETLIVRSRQQRKLLLGLVWLPIVGLGLVLATLMGYVGNSPGEKAGFAIAGVVVAVASYMWMAMSVRCPTCGTKLLWHAMSSKSPDEWLHWLITLERCPSCGNDGSRLR